MKALILCASARVDGSTVKMCNAFSDVVDDCDTVMLSAFDIRDCTGCQCCRSGGRCVIDDDDMGFILDKMKDADLLVFATPIRFSGMSSYLKRFIDRLNVYWFSDLAHPRFACAMMCGGSPEPKFSNVISELKATSITVGMGWRGELCIGGTDSSEIDEKLVREFAERMISE